MEEINSSRTIWDLLDQGLSDQARVTPSGGIWDEASHYLNLANYCPKPIHHVELAELTDRQGQKVIVMRNPNNSQYLSIGEEEFFVWNLMDGSNTIRDISVEFVMHFGRIGNSSIANFATLLKKNGFLVDQPTSFSAVLETHLTQKKVSVKLKQAVGFFLHSRFASNQADRVFSWIYNHLGRLFFNRFVYALASLMLLVDVVLTFYLVFVAHETMLLQPEAGSHDIIFFLLASSISLCFHELAHGLTVKHYSRKVLRAGFLVIFGSPIAYVDTTDIWMKDRKARIMVSLAGPIVNGVIGGSFLLLSIFWPESLLQNMFVHIGKLNSILFLANLLPIIETDGHYVIQDWLERPRIRPEALAFMRRGLWIKLYKREKWTKIEWQNLTYGSIAVVGIALMVAKGLHLWLYTVQHFVIAVWENPLIAAEIFAFVVLLSLLVAVFKFGLFRRSAAMNLDKILIERL